jgi:hypothetical protein
MANLCLDTIERLKATCTKANGCTCCVASKGELNLFRATFARKSTPDILRQYEALLAANAYFTEAGTISNKAGLKRAEQELGQTRLVRNAFWSFRFFCVYCHSLPDALHMADLGIFPHILFAIVADWRSRVFDHLEDGEARLHVAMDRLAAKLSGVVFLNNEGVGSAFVCRVGHRIVEAQNNAESTPILKAWEFRRLSMVLPWPWSCCVGALYIMIVKMRGGML